MSLRVMNKGRESNSDPNEGPSIRLEEFPNY